MSSVATKTSAMHTTKKSLLAALTALSEVVDAKQTIPVCQHVLFESTHGATTVFATSLSTHAGLSLEVEVGGTASPVTIPHRELLAFVKALPDGPVTLESMPKGHATTVASGTSRITLQGFPADEMPRWKEPEGAVTCLAPAAALASMIGRALKCVPDVDAQARTGVQIEFTEAGVYVQSTDGYRLFAVGRDGQPRAGVLAPSKSAQALVRFLALSGDVEARVQVNNDWSWWTTPLGTVSLLQMSGKFPNMRRHLQARQVLGSVTHRVDDLRRAMARVSALATKTDIDVRVRPDSDGLSLVMTTPRGQVHERVLSSDIVGEVSPTGFNWRYLAQAAEMFGDAESIRMECGPAGAATAWVSDEDPHHATYVAMPIREK